MLRETDPAQQFPIGPGLPEAKISSAYFKTQMALLTTPNVLQRAVNDPRLNGKPILDSQPDSVSWLRQALRVEQIQDTGLIKVGLEGGDPKESVELITAVVDAYLSELKTFGDSANNTQIKQTQEVIQELRTEAEKMSAQLRRLAKEGGIDEPDPQVRRSFRESLHRELSRLDLDIVAAKIERDRVHALKKEQSVDKIDASKKKLEILEAQRKLVEAAHARAANAEWKSVGLKEALERKHELVRELEEQLRDLKEQSTDDLPGVTILSPPFAGSSPH